MRNILATLASICELATILAAGYAAFSVINALVSFGRTGPDPSGYWMFSLGSAIATMAVAIPPYLLARMFHQAWQRRAAAHPSLDA